jgi:hypothetical protein
MLCQVTRLVLVLVVEVRVGRLLVEVWVGSLVVVVVQVVVCIGHQ